MSTILSVHRNTSGFVGDEHCNNQSKGVWLYMGCLPIIKTANVQEERETDRQTDRQRQRETERQTQRERETERETERQRDTDRETQTDRQTDRQRDRQTDRQIAFITATSGEVLLNILRCQLTY